MVLSIIIAVQVSFVALASFRLSKTFSPYSKLAAAALLGIAISSMHYIGMAAASFVVSSKAPDLAGTLSVSALGATGIAAVSLAILALGERRLSAARVPQQTIAQSRLLRGTLSTLI